MKKTYKDLQPNQLVRFTIPNGLGPGGEQQFKERSARVAQVYEKNVVVFLGGKGGVPFVVDDANFVRAGKAND